MRNDPREPNRTDFPQAAASPSSNTPDQSLDATGSSSDIAAFTVFYVTSAPRLVAFLCWQGASLADAAECAQEALTQAFQRWSSIDHPHAWCRLVGSRLYARRIASVERPTENLEDAGSPLLSSTSDITALEQRHDVLRLLDQLPTRQRQVMAWTYDGATSAEIATALQISPEAVRSNLKKARIALRQHLQHNGGSIP